MKLTAFVGRGWRNIREAGPRRLALTIVLVGVALLIARFGWSVPFVGQAETSLYDFRNYQVAAQHPVEQDPRVVLVVYSEQTLIKARKRSPLDRRLLVNALRTLDTMGAKAIGIDVLIDQPQDEDDELVATLRAMKTPVSVAYIRQEANQGDIVWDQQQYLDSFMARLKGSRAQPASVQMNEALGAIRLWPVIDPRLPPTMTRQMLQAAGEGARTMPGYEGAIRFRLAKRDGQNDEAASGENAISEPLFNKYDIDLLGDPELAPLMAPELAPKIAGHYVLIGGSLVDFDRKTTTLTDGTGEQPPGMEVHAEMLAQMLDGARLTKPLPITLWALALLFTGMAVLTGLLEWGSWRIYLIVIVQMAVMAGIPFVMQTRGVDTYGLPAVGWLAGWIVAFTAVTSAARAAGAVQRNFAQGALGKYLPREMAQEIIEKPELLALHGEKKEIYVLFSDLEGFTKMSHALAPEMVAKLLNRYLEMLSQVVLDHGGVIDKFVGDAVVAFWGAPIARADDAERAARAGYAMWQAGERFRAEVAAMDPNLPPVGKTRVGLHFGEAVVGNFGGETRIQYTALGDSMNTAARLESANKALGTSVMASCEFAERSGLGWWRRMGKVVLSGRSQPVDLFEPVPDFPEADRAELAEAVDQLVTDHAAALARLKALAARHPGDAGLQELVVRSADLNPEGAHVLKGK